ncbi:cytochrome c oxidase subunit I [Nitrosococcus wardiae]|uniref:cytochrome-c oxidase n=1 Tax=Nitrosococcus wardiae TaxID=1814290 RepID=A0A4P7BZP5_9GAMM|nr:cytochrome c oxidase subunit I [Nitrosococcus wardiae]QBQ55718.1 cytochrome c oxidase subunit I [Nitrosococcus wardiae]
MTPPPVLQPDNKAVHLHERLQSIWQSPPGMGNLCAVNHTTIGLRFIVTAFIFFLIGGIEAMLIRSQLAIPGNTLLNHDAYNEIFTMHGTTMMFLFSVPIMEGFAIYLIPKMIGARDLIFPRLSAFVYWCFLFGGILLYSSFLVGAAPNGGWFMYVPLNSQPFAPGLNADFWLLGVTLVEISAVGTAIELIVSILKTRSPGMAIHRMPLYAWYILITAFMIVFGFPPLILASILLEIERTFGIPFYEVADGGDPLLWQHLFWFFGHPDVYIIFLPAAGLVTTMLPTFAQRPVVGYTWLVLAVIGTGFISFGLWVHHMFAVGIPLLSLAFFSAASMTVVIPAGIQVFAWIATLWNGRPVMETPLLFILGFLFIFVAGGLTGVMVALVPFDWQAHDTHFVVAHFHYVLFGGMVFPLFAALYYWLPLWSGKIPSKVLSRLTFWLIFIGFNLTFLPMHITGLLGMPRRVYTYAPDLGWNGLNFTSTVGGFLTAVGVGIFVIDFLMHFRYGKPASKNSWNAGSLEWALKTPVPPYNFASQPLIEDRYPLWHKPALEEQVERGAYFLGDANVQRRETLMTGTLRAKPEQIAVLAGNTWTPLITAIFTLLFFIGFLAQIYWFAAIGLALALTALLFWAWQGGDKSHEATLEAGCGYHLPIHFSCQQSPGWWGMLITLVVNIALFGSLIFAYFYLWTVSPAWPPAGYRDIDLLLPSIGMAMLLASGGAIYWGGAENRIRHPRHNKRMRFSYIAGIVLAMGFIGLQTIALLLSDISAKSHAYGALLYTISGFQIIYVFIAILMAGFVVLRSYFGYIDQHRPVESSVTATFWYYMILQWLAGFATIHLFPFLVGEG